MFVISVTFKIVPIAYLRLTLHNSKVSQDSLHWKLTKPSNYCVVVFWRVCNIISHRKITLPWRFLSLCICKFHIIYKLFGNLHLFPQLYPWQRPLTCLLSVVAWGKFSFMEKSWTSSKRLKMTLRDLKLMVWKLILVDL